MYMFVNKKWQINQLEPLKQPWFVIVIIGHLRNALSDIFAKGSHMVINLETTKTRFVNGSTCTATMMLL